MEDEPMAKPLLTDELWELIEPFLPSHRPRPKGGRKPIDHRRTLTGILFVLKTGIPWEDLPQEMGCGSGMTCWRRLHEWQEAGVWQDIHHLLLNRLRQADKIDWSRAVVDSASVRAVFGGRTPAPTPRIAGKTARSTMSSPMRMVFRWPRFSLARTATT
jgi:transposase